MRIQHNIMAMSAYRNYNNNTSALSKNLEKLSSGYKINRAGDDAAGLAISEKMRAQITGLNAAQKNVKDGISLVKTAEGAMQEIQDMLNRMDYLATQSANGTYQDEVDRENLNKEMEALKTEINRIAESANFNGIKLLDGSLDPNSVKGAEDAVDAVTNGSFELPKVGQTIGVNTVLHNDADGTTGTEFSVDLHNFHFKADAGSTMSMKVGDTTFNLTVNEDGDGTELTGEALAEAIVGENDMVDVKIGDTAFAVGNEVKINGQSFTVTASGSKLTFVQEKAPTTKDQEVDGSMKVSITGATAGVKGEATIDADALYAKVDDGTLVNGDKIKIGDIELTLDTTAVTDAATLADALVAAAANSDTFTAEKNADGDVVLTAKEAGEIEAPAVTFSRGAVANSTASATEATEGENAVAASYTVDQTADPDGGTVDKTGATADGKWDWSFDADGGAAGTGQVVYTATTPGAGTQPPNGADNAVAGKDAVAAEYTIDLSAWDKTSELDMGGTKYDTMADLVAAIEAAETDYNVTETDGVITLTAKTAGAIGGDGPADAPDVDVDYAAAAINDKAITGVSTVSKQGQIGGEIKGITEGANGDWNVSTTDIKNVTAEGVDRLASTYFDLTEDMTAEGASVRIGDLTYVFTSDKDKLDGTTAAPAGTFYVDNSSKDLDVIAKKLTEVAAASNNAVYTVGHDGSRITVTENDTYDNDTGNYDLRTEEGVKKSLGFSTNAKDAVAGQAGKGLNLQIGDTSDEFNQMKIEVGDMHVEAMKFTDEDGNTTSIREIDIKTSENAQAAVDVIKNAINYVSGVRGDLGAYQNRLEHTANNLSVMAENIQDAESSIRDTDIAEEMMSYTKNNILVQSAQAMLAQANQVPQGVLQLLG